MSRRKGQYKIRTVIETVQAPTQYSAGRPRSRIITFEKLSCGHYHQQPEVRETAKMIRVLANLITGTPQKRRCFQCVSGTPTVPEISRAWVAEHDKDWIDLERKIMEQD
jgi:hypothetical protein